MGGVILDLSLRQIDREVGIVETIVGEVLLDHVAAVTQADDELVEPVMGEQLHDVPQDGPPADLDHRLGLQVAFLGDAGSKPTRQYDRFH
ncbi:hypothetical protein GALL_513630 [mine drainage metagenome]|uniref:Uncharacterized protein n=1 Tax=mine drainage metagenome TaxID=410659 RepID=A0A1J5P8J7_9ZZZZ